jgi:hypothetical protein
MQRHDHLGLVAELASTNAELDVPGRRPYVESVGR